MSAPVQLDLMDALGVSMRREDRDAHARALMLRYLDGRPETYSDRYRFGCLTPGEACPGCGHVFPHGGDDSSGDHHMPTSATECTGRRAYRQHAAHYAREFLRWEALNADDETILDAHAALTRAARAAAPCWPADVRTSWIEHPEQLIEVTA